MRESRRSGLLVVVVLAVFGAGCAQLARFERVEICSVARPAAGSAYANLAAAVDGAADGETLVVTGTCMGATRIVGPRTLTITGKRSHGAAATLDGSGLDVPLLYIEGDVRITLNSITLTDAANSAIRINGDPTEMFPFVPTVDLNGVTIAGNVNTSQFGGGGGISNTGGRLHLNRGTTIARNQAFNGGGIWTHGIGMVVLSPGARIVQNTATNAGGGIYVCECFGWNGGLDLAGGIVKHNRAPLGADVYRDVIDPDG